MGETGALKSWAVCSLCSRNSLCAPAEGPCSCSGTAAPGLLSWGMLGLRAPGRVQGARCKHHPSRANRPGSTALPCVTCPGGRCALQQDVPLLDLLAFRVSTGSERAPGHPCNQDPALRDFLWRRPLKREDYGGNADRHFGISAQNSTALIFHSGCYGSCCARQKRDHIFLGLRDLLGLA